MTEPRSMLDEAIFANILNSERRRTDRSGRPFLLLLLAFRPPAMNDRSLQRPIVSTVLRTLKACKRQTDLVGWYQNHTIIGVVFTELRPEAPARDRIVTKVHTALQAHLKPAWWGVISLSAHLYPPQDNDESNSDLLFPERLQKKSSLLFKRGFDILGSLGLLVLLSPLFLLIATAIKLTSKGPVLFKQTRLGQFGRPFTFLKFRSMYTNSDPSLHEQYIAAFIRQSKEPDGDPEALKQGGLFKLHKDPRVTPAGHLIRLTSLDELPQLFNVLVGDMSLVGPRPPIPYEVERYDLWHKRRVMEVRPGLTGLWQVKGRSLVTFDDMVRLDLKYVDEWSLWNDIKILLQTPWAVIKCAGAR
jgi:lipopolysaccharide/colanic/teichoic acid biosynthesis glycosyltransferase